MDVVETSTSTTGGKSSGRGVGSRLKQAREAKGVTLDAVASELYILKRHLDAIERDDYDSLPQPAFTRGFVLSYAKYLKLDVDSILKDFDVAYPKEQVVTENPLTESVQAKQIARVSRNQGTQKTSFGRYGLLLALLGLVGLGVFYYYKSNQNNQGADAVASYDKVSTVDSIRQEEGIDISATDPSEKPAEANQESSTDNVSGEAVKPDEASINTADLEKTKLDNPAVPSETVVVDPNAAPSEVVFWVRRNTDITIKDQTGQVVMSGTKSRGEHKASGKPPFSVSISRAANVELNLDKIPQRNVLRQNTQADGSASFTLSK